MRCSFDLTPFKSDHFLTPIETQINERAQIGHPKVSDEVPFQRFDKWGISLFFILKWLDIESNVAASDLEYADNKSDEQATVLCKLQFLIPKVA